MPRQLFFFFNLDNDTDMKCIDFIRIKTKSIDNLFVAMYIKVIEYNSNKLCVNFKQRKTVIKF